MAQAKRVFGVSRCHLVADGNLGTRRCIESHITAAPVLLTLKGFRWADLELTREGKRLVSASIMPQKTEKDGIHLEIYMDPAAVPDTTMTIFSYDGLGGTGYQLKLKDFLPKTARR